MLRYKMTLQKDLPGFPVGTVFSYTSDDRGWKYIIGDKGNVVTAPSVWQTIDDPMWFRKELDESCLVDLKCPICGETRCAYDLSHNRRYCTDGDHIDTMVMHVEYACGHKRVL